MKGEKEGRLGTRQAGIQCLLVSPSYHPPPPPPPLPPSRPPQANNAVSLVFSLQIKLLGDGDEEGWREGGEEGCHPSLRYLTLRDSSIRAITLPTTASRFLCTYWHEVRGGETWRRDGGGGERCTWYGQMK